MIPNAEGLLLAEIIDSDSGTQVVLKISGSPLSNSSDSSSMLTDVTNTTLAGELLDCFYVLFISLTIKISKYSIHNRQLQKREQYGTSSRATRDSNLPRG